MKFPPSRIQAGFFLWYALAAGCGSEGAGSGAPDGAGAAGGSGGSGMSTASGGSSAMPTGSGGANSGGGATGGLPGDDYVAAVTIAVHPQTTTILNVSWTQAKASESVWLEFSFAGSEVFQSRPLPGTTGAHKDVVLGVPAATAITVRIVNRQATVDYKTKDYLGMTGALPASMPKPTVAMWDPVLATPDRWLFGSVENSDGGCSNTSCYYHTTFWLYIMDRMGRIVWYYADGTSNATSSFQRIARDGEYIWIEKRPFDVGGARTVLKMTLDRQYSQTVTVPGLADCIDVTTDGSLLYDANNELREMSKTGTVRPIWNCRTHFGAGFQCYTNTINWDPASDSILMSYPEATTVIQVSRANGTVIGQYGSRSGSYAFMPTTVGFEYQHFPNLTMDGTLILSTHLKGYSDGAKPVANKHAFMELTIDRTNKRLVEKWTYTEGPEWAMYKGMAIRLPNGNTLGNYGTGGVIREITPDKKTVFYVKWDAPSGNDAFNKMVGHNVFVNDLYALNGGGPK